MGQLHAKKILSIFLIQDAFLYQIKIERKEKATIRTMVQQVLWTM